MKKVLLFSVMLFASLSMFAQGRMQKDGNQMEMIRELNLTKTQKVQLRDLHQSMKANKEAIESDQTLTDDQKKEKLKEARKEQMQKINGMLTPEQRENFKEKMMEKRNKRGDGEGTTATPSTTTKIPD